MEILRNREDFRWLSKKEYNVAFRQSRDEACKRVFGSHIFNRFDYYKDFRKKLFSEIGKELGGRPRKYGRRTHPKVRVVSKTNSDRNGQKPLTLNSIGDERTRKALERDLREEAERKEAVNLLQTEFSEIISSQYY